MRQTVLVTGATGFIAKHIVLQLLDAGYNVRGAVRSPGRMREVSDAVRPHLTDPDACRRLSFVALDLEKDQGWREAMSGIDALIHTASPFPMKQPRNEQEVIRPAVDGTLRALRAASAAGVRRVVLTSSTVAVTGSALRPGCTTYDENDWTDPGGRRLSAYQKSKTLAERAAWEFADSEGLILTVINPGFVLGPPLDENLSSSVKVVRRILRTKVPAVPNVGYAMVDVRDAAMMHVAALSNPGTIGKRIIGASRFIRFADIARILKSAYPDRKVPVLRAPDFVMRGLQMFDKSLRSITPELGRVTEVDNRRARELFGMEFIDPEESVLETARFILERKLV